MQLNAPPNAAATEMIVRQYAYLASIARRLCRDHIDPNDLVHEVFEKTMRAARPLPDGPRERAWLSRVLRNLFVDKLRRHHARHEHPLDEPVEQPTDEGPWWQRLTMDQLQRALRWLPEDQRITFELFALEGRSYEQIAAALGIAKPTVGTRILRARVRLRELLTAQESAHDGAFEAGCAHRP